MFIIIIILLYKKSLFCIVRVSMYVSSGFVFAEYTQREHKQRCWLPLGYDCSEARNKLWRQMLKQSLYPKKNHFTFIHNGTCEKS